MTHRNPDRPRAKRALILAMFAVLALLGILASPRKGDRVASPSTPDPVPPSAPRPVLAPVLPAGSPVAALLDPARFSHGRAVRDLAALSRSLDPAEQRALLREVEARMSASAAGGLKAGHVHHVFNDMVSALLRQEEPLPELAPALVAIARDTTADPVLRDYAVQALGEWLEWPRTRDSAPDGTPAIVVETLFGLAYDRGSALSGTALLSLDRVASLPDSRRPEGLVRPALLEAALRSVASDPDADPGSRASALLAGQRHGATGIADFARPILSDAGLPGVLRAAAATVLGAAGDRPEDRALLESLADPADNSRLAFASRAALAKHAAQP